MTILLSVEEIIEIWSFFRKCLGGARENYTFPYGNPYGNVFECKLSKYLSKYNTEWLLQITLFEQLDILADKWCENCFLRLSFLPNFIWTNDIESAAIYCQLRIKLSSKGTKILISRLFNGRKWKMLQANVVQVSLNFCSFARLAASACCASDTIFTMNWKQSYQSDKDHRQGNLDRKLAWSFSLVSRISSVTSHTLVEAPQSWSNNIFIAIITK